MAPSTPREYLYIDGTRLTSYLEQIQAPVTYDKVPLWKVGLSLIGPNVEGAQSRVARPLTQEERLQSVISHLENKRALLKSRPGPGCNKKLKFCLETFQATRYAFFGTKVLEQSVPSFHLWVATDEIITNGVEVRLFLIEDFRRSDEERVATLSGYSALRLMADELPALSSLVPASDTQQEERILGHQMLDDTDGFLQSLGGHKTGSRSITCLYRIRATCIDAPKPGNSARRRFVLGYPIAIWEESEFD